MSIRIQCITIDAADPKLLGDFWSELLGWRITYDESEEVVIEPQEDTPECDVCPDLLFIKVDDRKQVKNRLHLDLRPHDQDVEVTRAMRLGARKVDIGQDGTESWIVMADPEGNEFCILRPLTEEELAT